MRPSLRRVLVLALGLLLVVTIAGAVFTQRARSELRTMQAVQATAFARWNAEIAADVGSFSTHPLLLPREGGDASAVFFRHVPWRDGPGSGFSAFQRDVADWRSEWVRHEADARLDSVDLDWLARLAPYGWLDLDAPGSPREAFVFGDDHAPWLANSSVWFFVKVRLLRGLRDDALCAASAEVSELTRLLLSAEEGRAFFVGVGLLREQRRAWERAKVLGQQVDACPPMREADGRRLLRVFFAARLSRSLVATEPASRIALGPLQCVSLAEAAAEAHVLSTLLRGALRERYDALDAELAASPCRLRRARENLRRPAPETQLPVSLDSPCLGSRRARCDEFPSWRVGWLPFTRVPLGVWALSMRYGTDPPSLYDRTPVRNVR